MRTAGLVAAAALAVVVTSRPVAAANLVANPGFEDIDLAAWSAFGSAATLERTATQSHDGSHSLFVHARTQTWGGPAQNLAAVMVPGTRYVVSAWVRMDTDAPARPALNIKRVLGGSTTYTTIRSVPTGHTRWIKLTGVYEYFPSSTPSEVSVYVHGPSPDRDFYVDEVSVEPFPTWIATPSSPSDFVRRSGAGLVVGPADVPIQLRGVNFTAYDDENESADVVLNGQDFDPDVDFQRVADLGGNAVRLNLWWKVFENPSSPYTYSDSGWAWLERILVAARAAGVRLILDMHAPQGGFQGPGYSGSYWSSPSLQARHEALLVEMASRYRDEPWIAAWDILNEPSPPNDAAWRARAEELVDAVRAVDPNHLLIVEQSFADDYGPFLVGDPNVVYEFHWYERWRWVSQLSYPGAWGDYGVSYPDAGACVPPWDDVVGALQPSAQAPTGTTPWTWITGVPFSVGDPAVFGGVPVLWGSAMSGKLWLDEFVVEELDANDDVVRMLTSIDIEPRPTQWWDLTEYEPFHSFTADWGAISGSGSWGVEGSGHRGSASVSLRGTSGTLAVGTKKLAVALVPGRRYRVSGWIRTDAMTGTGGVGLQLLELAEWDSCIPFTKSHLETTFADEGMTFYAAAGVPVHIGEFGVTPRNFLAGRGGDQWLDDTLDLFDAHGAGYSYFDWHSANFGAWTNVYGMPEPAGANQPLLDALAARWGGPGLPHLIAIAGRDATVRVGQPVELDGSTSVGTVTAWSWQQIAGPPVVLTGADTPAPSFEAPASAATLEFRLAVTGPAGTDEDDVVVSVIEPCPSLLDATGCVEPLRAAVSVDERRAGSEKLKLQWKGLDGDTDRSAFGDPVSGTSRYALCLYADGTLAGEYFVDRAGAICGGPACWSSAGSGWNYKDASASASGIRQIQARSGPAGKGSVKARGQNNAKKGWSSLPTGVAAGLSNGSEVVAQVRIDDGLCIRAAVSARTRETGRYSGSK